MRRWRCKSEPAPKKTRAIVARRPARVGAREAMSRKASRLVRAGRFGKLSRLSRDIMFRLDVILTDACLVQGVVAADLSGTFRKSQQTSGSQDQPSYNLSRLSKVSPLHVDVGRQSREPKLDKILSREQHRVKPAKVENRRDEASSKSRPCSCSSSSFGTSSSGGAKSSWKTRSDGSVRPRCLASVVLPEPVAPPMAAISMRGTMRNP